MKKVTEEVRRALDDLVKENRFSIDFPAGSYMILNANFIGNVEEIAKELIEYCDEKGIYLKTIDVFEEENHATDLLNLFNELEQHKGMLYLKNYPKVRSCVRYRFASIYKDLYGVGPFGIVQKQDLHYLGTVIISEPFDGAGNSLPLDGSERSCFICDKIGAWTWGLTTTKSKKYARYSPF